MQNNIILRNVMRAIDLKKVKLKKQGLCENFGQDEIRKFRDRYNLTTLSEITIKERDLVLNCIDKFEDWCNSYAG